MSVGSQRKVCVITGSRADYGLLEPIMKGIRAAADLELCVIATGMHLSTEFGETWRGIEEDGYAIDAKVESLLSSDTGTGIAKSMALCLIGIADALDRLGPDIVLLLGDRFEVLAAAQAALATRIPVAHVAGGDITEGSLDDSMRHAITKLAHLHFATNVAAAERLVAMGEHPNRVVVSGSPGVDKLLNTPLLDRAGLGRQLGIQLRDKLVAVSFHPATAHPDRALKDFEELLAALDHAASDASVVFTGSNADQEGRSLLARMSLLAKRDPERVVAVTSLGSQRYLSLLKHATVLVGNSSSGFYEAPSFGTPTINVGDRQRGRIRGPSIVDVAVDRHEISEALSIALAGQLPAGENPYGDGHAAEIIVNTLRKTDEAYDLLVKTFYSGGH